MKSRWITNLLLLLAVVLLGLVARYEPGLETETRSQAITGLKLADIHRIHINRPIRDDLVLVRQDDKTWEIDRAAPVAADDFKVRALARLAEQHPVRSYPADTMNLADLQLAPPYATAIINDISIEFGNLEPIDDLRFVRVNDIVHLIPDNYLQLMETSFTQFVRPGLLPEKARISAIELPGLSIRHTVKGWETTPAQAVDDEVLQQFFDIWQQASSQHIQPANPELDGDVVGIELGAQSAAIEFMVIAREPDLVLARPDWGIQYRLGNRSEAMLTLDAASADVRE